MASNAAQQRILIGGQAVIEGVMMRSPRWTSTAVRAPDGAIAVFTEARPSPLVRRRWLRLPVLRGVIALYDAYRPQQRPDADGQGELFFVLPAALIRLMERSLGNVYALNIAEGALR